MGFEISDAYYPKAYTFNLHVYIMKTKRAPHGWELGISTLFVFRKWPILLE